MIYKREQAIVLYYIPVDQSSGWPCSVVEGGLARPLLSSNGLTTYSQYL